MSKRKATRGEEPDGIKLRVALPFIHRGERVFIGDVISCTPDEAQGCIFHGWAVPLVNGAEQGRHQRRDMRAKQ